MQLGSINPEVPRVVSVFFTAEANESAALNLGRSLDSPLESGEPFNVRKSKDIERRYISILL